MVASRDLLTVENPVFRSYLFYCCILGVKMIAMSFLTAKTRFQKRVFANPEDAKVTKGAKVKFDDEDIERIRRAHLNDLENIPIFLFVALVYIATDPNPWIAENIFRVFTLARIAHTISYAIIPIRQPTRAIVFGIGLVSTIYMIIQGILKFAL